ILYGANFGRDADTIASMAGALSGALHGASALPGEWVEKIRASGRRDQAAFTTMLVDIIHQRAADLARVTAAIQALEQTDSQV
ncbi:MAG: ADP-ribosylglycohydrolase family protein, partial [Planctomycetes bacterium]|nr:ADP-ribosylglycohydrolase family protein [Planctomycetota bacterium]